MQTSLSSSASHKSWQAIGYASCNALRRTQDSRSQDEPAAALSTSCRRPRRGASLPLPVLRPKNGCTMRGRLIGNPRGRSGCALSEADSNRTLRRLGVTALWTRSGRRLEVTGALKRTFHAVWEWNNGRQAPDTGERSGAGCPSGPPIFSPRGRGRPEDAAEKSPNLVESVVWNQDCRAAASCAAQRQRVAH